MKKLIIFILLAIPFLSFGQTEKKISKKISDVFVEFYNVDDYKQIFELFSSEMQTALPLKQTIDFFKGLQSQVGKIGQIEFLKYENGSYASYKTNFESAVLSVNLSLDNEAKINGLFVKPYREFNLPKLERNKTSLILPFKDEWTVFWGGDTEQLNYHIKNEAQKNAFDFVVTNEQGKTYKTDGKSNEDYYAFGKDLIAPCDAVVVLVVDGVKDNIPGDLIQYMYQETPLS